MQTKRCTKCGEIKPLNEFYKKNRSKDGLAYECKICFKERIKEYSQTKEGLITKIHRQQRRSSLERNHNLPTYNLQELRDWCFSQKLFHELYDNWKASGFKTALIPSCDRTDDYMGYSLDRLQITTWEKNRQKGYDDRKNRSKIHQKST